ncbi:MAG: IS5/IS1182 family transposase, partial [Dehalococcoidia bacterium]|nr:IS5/IS1182 family transposase [Dehalococcoidia bacterium]
MPFRPFSRDRVWLLPPFLGDLIPEDHAARFVAAFVDGLDRANWAGMGIEVDGDELGAPAYHPQALLS